ncbi:MAG: tRNA pseudouridine(55) synthase TruB [Candidatus Nanopelagicales bacterium]
MTRSGPPGPDGLVVVDKPAGMTSHDVVARMRRIAGTRKVGHAGTLDPMATGVLLLGLGRATRLLGHLALTVKEYDATIRLGVATVTDDAEGEPTAVRSASEVDEEAVRAGVAALTGDLLQRPSAVSAVKVDGRRSYARVRAGEDVELPARPVTVEAFDVLALRPAGHDGSPVLDVDVRVRCSSGTYVRALARDLGAALGVGGHLTALRRTRVGPFTLADAQGLEELAERLRPLTLEQVARRALACLDVDATTADAVRHGGRLPWPAGAPDRGPVALLGPDGMLLALAEPRDGAVGYLAVLA